MVRTVFGVLAVAAVACRIPEKVPLATDAADDAAATDAIVPDAASDAVATDAPSVDAPPIDAGGCGDGTRMGTEVCDGVDLGGQSCQTQGFASGTLACAANCAAYDLVGCDAPTPPVLRRPLANAYVGLAHNAGSMRPTFEWAAPAWSGTGALSYEIDLSTDSTFASGVTTATATATNFRPAADLAVSMTAPVGARYFWRVRACFRGRCSSSTGGRLLNVGRSGRDLNGDGYADVVVGGPAAGAGRAYVFMGRQGGGVEPTPDGTLTAGSSGDVFGHASIPGDLNGDGFADVAVGAYRYGATDTGRVYVYFGGAGATFNTGVDATLTGAGANAQLAASAGGDVNGDGYADLIVGAFEYPAGPGSVYVYLGGAGTFDTTFDARFVGAVAGDEFGVSVAVGDVNGDGFADVVAGAMGYDGTSTDVGAAYVYYGSGLPIDTTADGMLQGGAMQDYFGQSVACGGDVNGDGYDDVVVGAHEQDNPSASVGRAYVFYGGAAAVFDATPDGFLIGPSGGAYFGASVAVIGDVNQDGVADVAVGATGVSSGTGRAYVYFGGTGATFNNTPEGVLGDGATGTAAPATSQFGYAVGPAGDVNGDGYADLALGAPFTGTSTGTGYVFFGAAGSSFDPTADGTLPGQLSGEQFGYYIGR